VCVCLCACVCVCEGVCVMMGVLFRHIHTHKTLDMQMLLPAGAAVRAAGSGLACAESGDGTDG